MGVPQLRDANDLGKNSTLVNELPGLGSRKRGSAPRLSKESLSHNCRSILTFDPAGLYCPLDMGRGFDRLLFDKGRVLRCSAFAARLADRIEV